MKALPLASGPRVVRNVALLQADGALPNFALMRLSTYFRERGATVRLIRPGERRAIWDPPYACYGSSIFDFSTLARARLEREWAPVYWGGVGVREGSRLDEIDPAVNWDAVQPDYSLFPAYPFSIGYSQRGCRLNCGFCKVPREEGKARSVAGVAALWRGEPHPRKLVLLDNDFFGVPEWRDRVREIREGGFRVSFSQGINVRLIDEEAAASLATIEYRDNEFQERVLYTAWDRLGDERIFREGVARLERAGIPAKHLRVYMLVGYRKDETFDEIMYRYDTMRAMGCEPYPMVVNNGARPAGLAPDRTLKDFQRWAIRLARSGAIPWEQYDPHIKAHRGRPAPEVKEGT